MSNMIYILGDKLAQITGKQDYVCRGILRLSILEGVPAIQNETSDQGLAYVNSMTYTDWQAALSGKALLNRLGMVSVKDPPAVVAQLKQALVEKQSLLTLSAR